MAQFTGKTALVTGGGTGIGRAAALALAREGAKVAVAGVARREQEAVAADIRATGGEAIAIDADVSRPDDVAAMVDATIAAFGRLDFAFNNAGIEGAQRPLADLAVDDWQRVIAVNLTGVFLCMRAEIPAMLRQGGGAIVNCSSILGQVGFAGAAAYVAAKHGVLGLTQTAALDYATQGIRVNAVCPGFIHTPMLDRATGGDAGALAAFDALEPIGRMGAPEEIASAVVWLCSDGAAFTTGAAIPVDGGYLAR